MLSTVEADQIIREAVIPFLREDCSLAEAHGRILRAEIKADRDLPPFDRVTMDGFAVRAAELAAGRRRFHVDGVQAAGMRPFKLGSSADAAVEVMTGAVLPEGADCVIPYENAVRDGANFAAGDEAAAFGAGFAVHRRGNDRRAGDVVVAAGTRMTGREIAVAAACGCSSVTVAQVPKIAIVATGDELVEVGTPVAAHQVRRSNDHALRAALIAAGLPDVARFHLRDVPREIEHLLWHVIAEYDVVVVVGGVSKGKFDFVPKELERQGVSARFHGVAQRPGKPMWFGMSPRKTPVFALPGNPVSCYTCLHRYVLPSLERASGLNPRPQPLAALSERVEMKSRLAYFLPVIVQDGPKAERMAVPSPTRTSGDFSSLVGTDGFVELPAEPAEFPAGTVAPFWKWV